MSSPHKAPYLLIIIIDTHKMDRPQPLTLRPLDVIDIVIHKQRLFRLNAERGADITEYRSVSLALMDPV